MEIRVVCPGCKAVLRVPPAAAGQVARCPHCQGKFLVPDERDVIEETVSSWIEEDVDEMQDQLEEEWSKRHELEEARRKQREKEKRDKTASQMQRFMGARQSAPAAPPQTTAAPSPQPAARRPDTPPQRESRNAGAWQPSAETEEQAKHADATVGQAVDSDHEHDDSDVVDAHHYPQNLTVDPTTPHLVVVQCSQEGVLLAFDSACFKYTGFRASMPMVCVFSGDREKTNLIAKPLAFIDQSQATIRNAAEVEAGHERRLVAGDTPETLITQMDIIKGLPERFQRPMPYYVNADHATMSLECRTKNHEDGSTTCYVLMPDGAVALQWLAAVNGICGSDYHMLRNDVSRLWSKQWAGVPEMIRQRIGTWAGFQPGERFRYYINDAEFGKKDEGMAGMVFTDRRIIYHRYHRSGEAQYLANPHLVVRPDGDFAGVTIKSDEGSAKTIRLRVSDLERFREIAAECDVECDIRTN